MTYYDEQFKPFETVDGQVVVADEAEWGRLSINCAAVNIANLLIDNPPQYVVKVPTDIFEDVEGPVVDSDGERLYSCHGCGGLQIMQCNDCDCETVLSDRVAKKTTTEDLLTRFFKTIDSTPHVDYLIVTQHPESIRENWSLLDETGPRAKWVGFRRRPNVILAVPVETQADIERLVPKLLKCHDLCKGLAVVANPKEELDFVSVDDGTTLWDFLEGEYEWRNGKECGHCESLDLIIVEGDEHPVHPDWVRSLRDQCKDADVPFNFAGWGDWLPFERGPAPLIEGQNGENIDGHLLPDGIVDHEPIEGWWWPNGLQETIFRKSGHKLSGRLLDGQEHNGRIS